MGRTPRDAPRNLADDPKLWPNATFTGVEDPELRRGAEAAAALARAFAELRKSQPKASLRQIAEQARVNHATLSKIEKGTTWPDFRVAVSVAHLCGLDLFDRRWEKKGGGRKLVPAQIKQPERIRKVSPLQRISPKLRSKFDEAVEQNLTVRQAQDRFGLSDKEADYFGDALLELEERGLRTPPEDPDL